MRVVPTVDAKDVSWVVPRVVAKANRKTKPMRKNKNNAKKVQKCFHVPQL